VSDSIIHGGIGMTISGGAVTATHNSFSSGGRSAVEEYNSDGDAIVTLSGNQFNSQVWIRGGQMTMERNVFNGTGVLQGQVGDPPQPGMNTDVRDNLIQNYAGQPGIALVNGTSTIANNTIVHNGAGISVAAGAVATVANNIVAFNDGAGIQGGSADAMRNNDAFHNATDYAGVTGPAGQSGFNPVGANGNVSADPLFVNNAADFHLQAASPAINAGDSAFVGWGDTDLDGQTRIQGGRVDMGAYESGFSTESAPVTFADVAQAAAAAAGGAVPSGADMARWDVEQEGASQGVLDIADLVRLARQAANLEG
jgi:hypothetical protein